MELSPETESLLSELDAFSAGNIVHRADLGILLESGRSSQSGAYWTELGFYAKFLHRTYGIMTRIGPAGEGYERLAAEFSCSAGKARNLMTSLLAGTSRGTSASGWRQHIWQ